MLTVITCYASPGGRNIHNLCYGDGTTMIAENAKDLHTLVLKSKSTVKKKGLTLNIKKTTLMTTGTTTRIRTDIKVVESFCLSNIKSKGTNNQENAPQKSTWQSSREGSEKKNWMLYYVYT